MEGWRRRVSESRRIRYQLMAWRDGVVEFQRVGESDIIYSHGVEGWRRRVSESRRIRDQLQMAWSGVENQRVGESDTSTVMAWRDGVVEFQRVGESDIS